MWQNAYCDSFCKLKRSRMEILYFKIIGYCDIRLFWQFSLIQTVSKWANIPVQIGLDIY